MKKELILASIILLLALISFYFDAQIIQNVSLIKGDFLNLFFMGVVLISSKIIIFLFLTSLFLFKKQSRKWVLPLWVTFVFYATISFVLKIIIQRPRPFQLGLMPLLPQLEKASHLVWNFSFPSAHAMLIFCTIPLISKKFPKFKYLWIIFASLVAFSRIYFGLHFLSDVLIGGLIGYLIGFYVIKLEEKNNLVEKLLKFF